MVSSSVQAGLHSQLKAGAVNAAEYISPRREGYVTSAGKKAMKFGDCQWVSPGMILDSTSAWIEGHDSGRSGAVLGISSLRYPGSILGRTGRFGNVEL